MQAHSSLDFIEAPIPEKIAFGKNVLACQNANAAKFPNPPIAIKELETDNTDLDNAYQKAANGGDSEKDDLLKVEKRWIGHFRKTANYVSLIADSDEAVIRDGGFIPTSTTRTKASKPDTLDNLTAQVGTPGTLLIETKTSKAHVNAFTYIAAPTDVAVTSKGNYIEIKVGNAIVYVIPETHPKVNLLGLPQVKLSVYGAATNAAGTGPLTKTGHDVTIQ